MLILNYIMDEQDKLLSHQVEIVDMIAKKIDYVTVLTGKIGKVSDLGNINLNSYNWKEGKSLANIIKRKVHFSGKIFFNKKYPNGVAKKDLNIDRIKKIGWKNKILLNEGLDKVLSECKF